MNFLAHLYLSYPNKEEMTGNFIGDFVKGKQYKAFPSAISEGIKLHRLIDEYTDSHPLVLETKQMFKPYFKRYSGVVLDIAYDHLLAKYWTQFHPESLESFAVDCYAMLEERFEGLPERVQYILPKMKASRRLQSYADLNKTADAIEFMANFRSFYFDKIVFMDVMAEQEDEIKTRFFPFIDDLMEFTSAKRVGLRSKKKGC